MPKFNVTLLPVIGVKMCNVDAENPANAATVARTMLGNPPFYWMERSEPSPGVAATYDNDEIPYVMVDTIKEGADPFEIDDAEKIVERSDWFIAQMPDDMQKLCAAAWEVIKQCEPFAMKEKIAGSPIAAAVHNLQAALSALPPELPWSEITDKTNAEPPITDINKLFGG